MSSPNRYKRRTIHFEFTVLSSSLSRQLLSRCKYNQGMMKYYHIITRELPWHLDCSSINAYPVIPVKDVFEEWIRERRYGIDEPNGDGTPEHSCNANSTGGNTGTDDAGRSDIPIGQFIDMQLENFEEEPGSNERRPMYAEQEIEIEYGRTEHGYEEGINQFCEQFDIESLQYGKVTVARFGNGIIRTYDERGSTITEIGKNADREIGQMEQVGEYRFDNSKNHYKFHTRPWKLAVFHWGTKSPHWHFIYVSKSGQWGHNSKFGRNIRKTAYKCQSIKCMSCLRQYLYSGNGRQVVQDILTPRDISACQCVLHQMRMAGYDSRYRDIMLSECEERGNQLFTMESSTSGMGVDGLGLSDVPGSSTFDQETQQLQLRSQHANNEDERHNNRRNRLGVHHNAAIKPKSLIVLLVEKRAFNEGSAQRVLSREIQGIEFLFQARAGEKLKTAVSFARVLVFQESREQRLARAKEYDLSIDPDCNDPFKVESLINLLLQFLNNNGIIASQFFNDTFLHYDRRMRKKNNLFFSGPPSTGKTMLMETLVNCHYNFTRLTGLNSGSSFNFSSLLHTNACFMDECKLTENQFEQWKLLAGGTPMATDVKYKEKHDIEDCVLYTCSNYPIEMYVNVPEARRAIESRTIEYKFHNVIENKFTLNTFVWDECWKRYKTG